jgi:hypothetical protein
LRTLWHQNPSHEELFVERPILAAVYGTVNSAGENFWLAIKGDGETALKRIIGCAIIAHLPDEAMDEALTSLKDMYDFWAVPRQRMLSQPTVGQPIKGKVLDSVHRPDLVIPEQ